MIIGGVAGLTGSLMINKRLSLMGGPLGHLTMPGVIIALMLGFDVTIGALIILLISALLIWLINLKSNLPLESITAVVFSVTLALSFLYLPDKELNIALLGGGSVDLIIVISVLIIGLLIIYSLIKLMRGLLITGLNDELALTNNINPSLTKLLFLLLIAVVVSLSVRIVGGLMTAALISVPASASNNVSKSFKQYLLLSTIIGLVSGGGGVLLSIISGLPAGPLIVLVAGLFFAISLLIS